MQAKTKNCLGQGSRNPSAPQFLSMIQAVLTQTRIPMWGDTFSQPKRILIVDDEPSISDILGELLIEWGFAVVRASNGREGLQLVESYHVDGILLDLEMPLMDGRTMLDELRWRNNKVPVIVMSGGVPAESMRNLLCEGAQGFLAKPIRLEDLQRQCSLIFGKPVGAQEHVQALIA